ncbi:MAG: 2-amino-4-hydroxy-6-hydroxymethyldihydropteridine diphosphokinase [Terrimicrobiaceae bacterium]
MRAGIALGSNLGDRLSLLNEGRRRLLSLHDGTGPFLSSKIYETAPVDCPENSPSFLNAAIELSTTLPPLDLLARLQQIEGELGRPQKHQFHGPRTLDLDVLYYGDLQLSHESLVLPHPRISERLFVLNPLADICPDRILPGQDATIRRLCETCGPQISANDSIKFVSLFL